MLKQKEKEVGLCLPVGQDMPGNGNTESFVGSDSVIQQLYDIEIEDELFIWNSVNEDWVNSANAI